MTRALAILLLLATSVWGQEPLAPDRWTRFLDAPREGLAAHDLAWIDPTPREADALAEAEVAIARDRLSYLGYRKPAAIEPYRSVRKAPTALTRPYHVYRYRDVYLLTESDGRREQLCVYAIARALDLLAARAPDAYAELFVGPKTPPEQLARLRARSPKKSVSFLNLTLAHAFVLHGGFDAIAKSSYTLGPQVMEPVQDGDAQLRLGIFRNVATTTINLGAIQGWRSANLYKRPRAEDNFLLYLRDGLVETLVHEALHHVLRRDKNVRPLFWAITRSVRDLGGESLGKTVEEAFVANVSTRLLSSRGLSPRVHDYYRAIFTGSRRKRLGLVEGKETDAGVALRALLGRYRPTQRYEELFSFEVVEKR